MAESGLGVGFDTVLVSVLRDEVEDKCGLVVKLFPCPFLLDTSYSECGARCCEITKPLFCSDDFKPLGRIVDEIVV